MKPPRVCAALVVDDEPLAAKLLRRVLEAEGYVVTVASNGQEALDLLATMDRPTLIFTDFDMPVMNGEELIRAIEADPRLAGIPVVLLSGSSQASSVKSYAYLPKPAALDDLRRIARRAASEGAAWATTAPDAPDELPEDEVTPSPEPAKAKNGTSG